MSEDPEKQIAILRRKNKREKDARKTAEKQLEDYSRQIYLSNQALQRSLKSSQRREKDLEFLANASAGVASDQDIKELLHTTTELTASFSSAVCACYTVNENNSFSKNSAAMIRFGENDWRSEPLIFQKLLSLLPESDKLLDNWFIQDVTDELSIFNIDCHWLVALNFELISGKVGWIIFILDQEMLEEETLFVLDTAKSHIRAGVLRRVDRRTLEKKNRELKRAVLRLEKAQTQLIHSEKMASLGQLAAGVAHEINNPIGFILSNQRVMKDYVRDLKQVFDEISKHINNKDSVDGARLQQLMDDKDIEFLIEDMEALVADNEDGAEKVAEIVNSLKHFSHSGEMEFREIDIADCVDKSLKVAANALKTKRGVKVDIAENLPQVERNTSQLQQVIINLLVNAAHATPDNGTISVKVTYTEDELTISVSDDGCGMDEQTRRQLFTPFFTTKGIGEGTGLGLSVSLGIIEAHGGEINVISEPCVGSTFTIVLPLIDVA